jgi:hypothetical protein
MRGRDRQRAQGTVKSLRDQSLAPIIGVQDYCTGQLRGINQDQSGFKATRHFSDAARRLSKTQDMTTTTQALDTIHRDGLGGKAIA